MSERLLLADPVWLRRRYVDEGAGLAVIGREVGCAPGTVRSWLVRHGVPVRVPGAAVASFPGDRHGRFVVVCERGRYGAARAYLCRCDCGEHRVVPGTTLRRGRWLSCGCIRAPEVSYLADENGCWIWQRKVTWRGYGIVGYEGREIAAHRWVWLRERGELDPALDLHHRCGVRLCVNPDHLEPIDRSAHRRLHHEARRRAA